MLDDALIHLRYAENLRSTLMFTYDGLVPTYGTSSPFFVAVLAALSVLELGATLPKVASVGFLVALLAVIAWKVAAIRATRWWVFLLVLLSPMSFRWLADGMETSFTALLAVVLAWHGHGARRTAGPALIDDIAGFALGLVAVLTRIELGLGIAALVLATLVLGGRRELRLLRLPLALGGAAGYMLLFAVFGHVVPDTAVAKALGRTSLAEAVLVVLFSTATALSFGLGLLMLWCVSLAGLLRKSSVKLRVASVVVNSMVPGLVVLVAMRGQAVQGIRHLLWAYCFAIAWNLLALDTAIGGTPPQLPVPWSRTVRIRVLAVAAAVMAVWTVEAVVTSRILSARREVFRSMRDARLEKLAGMTGAAYDVGFVGYFSQAGMLDFSGLVNGRDVAAMSGEERRRWITRQGPDFLFVTLDQARGLVCDLDLGNYKVVLEARSRKLGGEELHVLALSAGSARLLGLGGAEQARTLANFVGI